MALGQRLQLMLPRHLLLSLRREVRVLMMGGDAALELLGDSRRGRGSRPTHRRPSARILQHLEEHLLVLLQRLRGWIRGLPYHGLRSAWRVRLEPRSHKALPLEAF